MKPRGIFLLSLSLMMPGFGATLAPAADDGAKIFAESCSGCHSTRVRPLDNVKLTRGQWKDAVERMIDQGAEVPKEKMAALVDYLAATHGPAPGAAPGKK